MSENKLPALPELMALKVDEVNKAKLFKLWLNQNPPQNWIKKIEVGNGKEADYLPIECVEHLLTTLMVSWHVEIKAVNYHFNVVNVVVRLHYISPVDNKEYWQDGTAGFEMYQSQKTNAIDRSARAASQNAETGAIKDAAEKIGNIFGKNLNRKRQFDYEAKFFTEANNIEATEK